jgi:RNA polymerase sigma-70 factor (ECF subfamily)
VGQADPDLVQGSERRHRDPARRRAARAATRALSTTDLHAAIEAAFREEHGRILAGLIRACRSFDLAEDALQEAFKAALAQWAETGLPRSPAAWITTTARRRLVDFSRRARTRREAQRALIHELEGAVSGDEPEDAGVFPDDRLRLIFTCCHPALSVEAQLALTLRTLGGLTTPEIARAFLVPEATLAQRIVRAKAKIADAGIPYEVPPPEMLPERLPPVLAVVYLVFNEGYAATAGENLVRSDLAAEAIRLGNMLVVLLPDEPEVRGLLALMLLHDSRRAARVNTRGELVPLEDQDRTSWDASRISEGLAQLEFALTLRRPGPYQLQAAIAALHAQAPTAAETDWAQISALYGQLVRLTPTPVVALNHAVAVAMASSLEEGLALVDRVGASASLQGYHLFHAARADLLRRLQRRPEAREAYDRALALATNRIEEAYLRRRIASLS